MSITFLPDTGPELKPRITVIGVGGAGGNAVNNMIQSNLEGVEFVVANTDAQALLQSRAERRIQLGTDATKGLGAGARPDIGRAAAEEVMDQVMAQLEGSNMVFITAGMGGGTGTGAAPVIARAAREMGVLTVGVVTKPFQFEGARRMRLAESGIEELQQFVDTLIIIPNQNLFRVATEKTTFADAFRMADDVLQQGVRGVTDLMIKPGLINLDFADIRTVMSEMGKAMMGTGEASGDRRAIDAAEAAISNPLLDDMTMKGAKGVLINITGGADMTLFEIDEATNHIRDQVDPDANIIFGSSNDDRLEGRIRISVVATGIMAEGAVQPRTTVLNIAEDAVASEQSVETHAEAQDEDVLELRESQMTGDSFIPGVAATPDTVSAAPEPAPLVEAAPSAEPPAEVEEVAAVAAPEPLAAAPASAPQPEPKRTNLFGLLKRHQPPARQAEPAQVFAAPTSAPVQPSGQQAAAVAQPEPQPRLSLDRADRLPQSRRDELDIPAFLRRQAN